MEDLILESPSTHLPASKTQLKCHLRLSDRRRANSTTKPYRVQEPDGGPEELQILAQQPEGDASISLPEKTSLSWGRWGGGSWLSAAGCALIITLCPLLVIFLWIALEHFQGSLAAALSACWSEGAISLTLRLAPRVNIHTCAGYVIWLSLQATLFTFLPGQISLGQLTPAGSLLKYKTNGLSAWWVTHILAIGAVATGFLNSAILAVHWESILVAANMYGILLPIFCYLKAYLAPTYPKDRKFSGSLLYDFYMGIELNPRFGQSWDFKLFHNGRPGIVAWTLIDLSYVARQYQLHGFVDNSIIIVSILHATYVVDFFLNEDWYLRTIDISHDHFGFYLAWGSVVWLPAVYTLQTQYLARYPVHLAPWTAAAILFAGLAGYMLFRSANHQKLLARRTNGSCKIWNRKAEYVRCAFTTADNRTHVSLLLCSGWWGTVRHANYTGDLILAYAMCATCGSTHLLPWTYALFMTVLLVHRVYRDEARCKGKYGEQWTRYCEKVRWKLIPGVF